jgi:hypothetical protein
MRLRCSEGAKPPNRIRHRVRRVIAIGKPVVKYTSRAIKRVN